jgi:MFS family permease
MLAHWSPPHERSRMTNLVYTGYTFGSAMSLIGGGYLMQYFDWTFLFYIVGILSIIWFILWTTLVYNTPSEHPYISTSELHLIEESMKENSIQVKTFNRRVTDNLLN